MKSQDMSNALRAFATLVEGPKADEMTRFAAVFDGGKVEPVAARVKRILAAWNRASVQPTHPPGLKRDLALLEAGLVASGAKPQVMDFQAVLSLFGGAGIATIDAFVARVAEARDASPAKSGKPELPPDREQARQLADELAAAVLDAKAFAGVVQRLEDSKFVSTPTLAVVANRFLGNAKTYKGRKPAINDIMKRHKDDLRSHARGKALDRIGV